MFPKKRTPLPCPYNIDKKNEFLKQATISYYRCPISALLGPLS